MRSQFSIVRESFIGGPDDERAGEEAESDRTSRVDVAATVGVARCTTGENRETKIDEKRRRAHDDR